MYMVNKDSIRYASHIRIRIFQISGGHHINSPQTQKTHKHTNTYKQEKEEDADSWTRSKGYRDCAEDHGGDGVSERH